MMQTCTISELNDRYAEIEKTVQTGRPVYLSHQGNHSIVIISAAMFEELTSGVEAKLDEADEAARTTAKRLTHREVFSSLRKKLHG